jgi:hypothetical protein
MSDTREVAPETLLDQLASLDRQERREVSLASLADPSFLPR